MGARSSGKDLCLMISESINLYGRPFFVCFVSLIKWARSEPQTNPEVWRQIWYMAWRRTGKSGCCFLRVQKHTCMFVLARAQSYSNTPISIFSYSITFHRAHIYSYPPTLISTRSIALDSFVNSFVLARTRAWRTWALGKCGCCHHPAALNVVLTCPCWSGGGLCFSALARTPYHPTLYSLSVNICILLAVLTFIILYGPSCLALELRINNTYRQIVSLCDIIKDLLCIRMCDASQSERGGRFQIFITPPIRLSSTRLNCFSHTFWDR
jgi:hypothetical protein